MGNVVFFVVVGLVRD